MKYFLVILCLMQDAQSKTCVTSFHKAACDSEVSPNPLTQFALTQRLGETLESCLGLLERFHWAAGIFCPDSNFCGLGFHLSLNYRFKWKRTKFEPAVETCQILVDPKKNSCDEIEDGFIHAGLFSGWRCYSGGNAECESQRGTECADIEGNVKCEGCLPGFEPQNATDETFCNDIDECHTVEEVCGEHGTCENMRGSYNCRCEVGYTFDFELAPNCTEEYPGWDVGLIYNIPSEDNFTDLFLSLSYQAEENYVNETFHDNLYNADQIMIVLYDRHMKATEELIFGGVKHVWNWFQPQNVKKSSLWDVGWVKNKSNFELNPDPEKFRFDIISHEGSHCHFIGFLLIVCDGTHIWTDCGHDKPLNEHINFNGNDCLVIYSRQSSPVKYKKALFASKIQILTQGLANQENFELVFSVEAFAGVDAYDYYHSGELQNPDAEGTTYANKLYRHKNIRDKIETASFIQLKVYSYNLENVVSEILFKGTNDSESWFAGNNIETSSLWEIQPWPNTSATGRYFQIATVEAKELRMFFINNKYNTCDGDRGWMVVVSRISDYQPSCYWEEWWVRHSRDGKMKHQPPYILYATTKESQLSKDWSEGGKIEIFTQRKENDPSVNRTENDYGSSQILPDF